MTVEPTRRLFGRWPLSGVSSREAVLALPSIGCELRPADAYHRVLDA